MFLSQQQKYILEVIKKLGCVRRTQLERLLAARYKLDTDRVEKQSNAMIRQLIHLDGRFRADKEFVWTDGKKPDKARLEAIDVMLELSRGSPADFKLDAKALLKFTTQTQQLHTFTILMLDDLRAPLLYTRQPSERIVWISEAGTPPPQLTLPKKHFFAVRQMDGSHRFYGSTQP